MDVNQSIFFPWGMSRWNVECEVKEGMYDFLLLGLVILADGDDDDEWVGGCGVWCVYLRGKGVGGGRGGSVCPFFFLLTYPAFFSLSSASIYLALLAFYTL